MVTYYGQMKTFFSNDFSNGAFDSWAKSVYSSYGNMNPCGSALSVYTQMNLAQGNIVNILSIMNALSLAGEIQLEAAERAAEEAEWANDPYGVRDMTPLMMLTLIYQSDLGMSDPFYAAEADAEIQAVATAEAKYSSESSSVASNSGKSEDRKKEGPVGNKDVELENSVGGKSSGDKAAGSKKGKSEGKKGSTNRVYSDFMKVEDLDKSQTGAVDIIGGKAFPKGVQTGTTDANGQSVAVPQNGSVQSKSQGVNGTGVADGQPVGNNTSGEASGGTSKGGDVSTSSKQSSVSETKNDASGAGLQGGSNTTSSDKSSVGGSNKSFDSGDKSGSNTTSSDKSSVNGTNKNVDSGDKSGSNTTSSSDKSSVGSNQSVDAGGKADGSNVGASTNEVSKSNDVKLDVTGSDGRSQGSTTGNGGSGQDGTLPSSSSESDKVVEQQKKTNLVGGAINSIQKSTEAQKPQIILSSDFAGFNFKNGDVEFGGKGSAGYTNVRWDGTKSHGLIMDYTSQINGPNLTAFRANITKRRVDLYSLTGTVGFQGKGSAYASVAVGQLWSFPRVKGLKVIYMAASSVGQVYREKFIGTALIAGGMYDWRASKRIDVKLVNLFIYAPYISYHDDLILKSPYVIVPLVGTNIAITKKFKFNVNFGGAYSIGQNVMNFTLMFGTRFAL